MINLVTTMSRYLMILLILIYTYYNFRFFSLPDDESKLRLCRLQNVPLFLIFLLSGTIIYLQTEDEAVVLFFGAQLVFFVLYQLLYRLFYRNASRLLLNNTCMLLCTSFIMLTRKQKKAIAIANEPNELPVYHHGSCSGYHNDYTICDR